MTQPLSDPPVYVWDPFVRVFHWSLVACVLLNFVVEEGETLHQAIGYAASALVVLKVARVASVAVQAARRCSR